MCGGFSWLIVDWMHIREVEELLFQGALPARCSGVFRGVRHMFIFVTEEEMKRDDS